MGNFAFEQTDPERFQKLCQSLIVAEFPNVSCYPVGQADGGRDAIQHLTRPNSKSIRVFQVKFVREPAKIRDAHKWLKAVLEEEIPKMRRLIERGHDIAGYTLVTNIAGTSPLESGTMDKADIELSKALGFEGKMWWRDDLNHRCEARPHIAWAYPEILRATDILVAIADSFPNAFNKHRYSAVRKFVIEQQDEDSKIRFQQVELTNDLLSLFIDVPASVQTKHDPRNSNPQLASEIARVARNIGSPEEGAFRLSRYSPSPEASEEANVGAAALLLDEMVAQLAPFIVLEGGPGQGKSTLGQFICQIHRMTVLGDPKVQSVNDYYRPKSTRLPIKVDLREYATWLAGSTPFGQEPDENRPAGWNRSLESFISALISERSGGMTFTVDDFNSIAEKSALLIVLDGLDEVADISQRNGVIEEISAAVRRLRDSSASLQVIVTSRPSALAEVRGFSPKVFTSWTLSSLTRPLISQYAEKWSVSEGLTQKERSDLKRVLSGKLNQAHMRELARNPMQLTILLSVIRTRGASLPDKRTTLYEFYVDTFFAREAGKNDIVKEFRDELLDIHRYLAWVLHAEAEKGRALGKIETSRLRAVLREYLASEERDPELADKLFRGVTQRVVFLVGAVEGQFRFEVQPLREYFAAKFLYDTAPHSSVGNPQPGTIDERFDAIARSTYWQNVTRFYAGCFSKGELPALVDRLEVLCEDGDIALTAYPRTLASTLAADWVFSQNARSLKRVIRLILADDGYRSLFRTGAVTLRSGELVLPDGCGRIELLDRCFEVMKQDHQTDVRVSLAQLANANSQLDEREKRWRANIPMVSDVKSVSAWLNDGHFTGALAKTDLSDVLDRFEVEVLINAGIVPLLARAGRFEAIDSNRRLLAYYLDQIAAGHITFSPNSLDHELAIVPFILSSLPTERAFFYQGRSVTVGAELMSRASVRIMDKIARSRDSKVAGISDLLVKLFDLRVEEFLENPRVTSELTIKIADICGPDSFALYKLLLRTISPSSPTRQVGDVCLLDREIDMADRTYRASRNKGSIKWWIRQLGLASTEAERLWVIKAALITCGPATLAKFLLATDPIIADLPHDSFASLFFVNESIPWLFHGRRNARVDGILKGRRLSSRSISILAYYLYGIGSGPEIIKKGMVQYGGDDPAILRISVLWKLAPMLDSFSSEELSLSEWRSVLDSFKKVYLAGVELFPLVWHFFNRTSGIPLELAREVAADRKSYPLAVGEWAEAACLRHLGERALPLIDVAHSEWALQER